jgi:hypothetical protein
MHKEKISLGFTGSQKGMTAQQLSRFRLLIDSFADLFVIKEFHHGCCIGADEQAHNMVVELYPKITMHLHPGNIEFKKAVCEHSKKVLYLSIDNLLRNKEIVHASSILIATPAQNHEITRSGTWATIRDALRESKQVIIIDTNGGIIVPKTKGESK